MQNYSFSLGGDNQIGKWQLNYLVFLSNSRNNSNQGRTYDFRSGALSVEIDDFYTDFANIVAPGIDIHDPFIINSFRDYVDNEDIIKGQNISAKINAALPFDWNGNNGLFKFGGKYRVMSNSRERIFREFNFINDGSVNTQSLFTALMSDEEDQQFLLNRVRFGPTLDGEKTDAFIASNPQLFQFDETNSRTQALPQFYDAQEEVLASYVMSRIQFNRVMLLGGFRYERTVVDYAANTFRTDGENIINETLSRVKGTRTFDFYLPNIHLRYSLDELTNIRAALTWSFARSNFADLAPTQAISIRDVPENPNDPTQIPVGNIDEGNAALLPARALNADLLFEKYFENVGIISGGLFYKRINDFNFTRQFTEQRIVPYTNILGESVVGPVNFNIEQPQNGDVAHLYGAEINLQAQLDFLPGLFSGLGVYTNYTYTHSSASTFERKGIRLPGQATHTANAALSYEYKGFSGRVALNFNGGVIRSLGPDQVTLSDGRQVFTRGAMDTWRADRYQVDVQVSYSIWKNLRVYAEFINLTNRAELEYFGERSRPSNIEFFDWWNRFGISYSL
ncbi:MAG: TonB-dependent receptor [Bacteroidia bacterium]|nr:TonB-dependent receptor [Bacteroidia bacterium]